MSLRDYVLLDLRDTLLVDLANGSRRGAVFVYSNEPSLQTLHTRYQQNNGMHYRGAVNQ
jgi:hypothetical protein